MVITSFPFTNLLVVMQAREGPVQFEKESADPFNVDKFLTEVEQNSSSKRGYGLQEEDSRQSKRPRVEEDDDA